MEPGRGPSTVKSIGPLLGVGSQAHHLVTSALSEPLLSHADGSGAVNGLPKHYVGESLIRRAQLLSPQHFLGTWLGMEIALNQNGGPLWSRRWSLCSISRVRSPRRHCPDRDEVRSLDRHVSLERHRQHAPLHSWQMLHQQMEKISKLKAAPEPTSNRRDDSDSLRCVDHCGNPRRSGRPSDHWQPAAIGCRRRQP